MKYVVAVSGGVDSVALLDMLVRAGQHSLMVAHFDHGIRAESADDARFVEGLAVQYGLPFVSEQAELGADASEALARQRRYDFLFRVATEHGARVVTAHHQDDVIETIALNIMRGTRWRGLACMGDERIERPLVTWSKQQVYDYVTGRRLEWVEDTTNQALTYTRNQLRRVLGGLTRESRAHLYQLWQDQHGLAKQITAAVEELIASSWPVIPRYMVATIDPGIARELLCEAARGVGTSLLTRQADKLVIALKTGRDTTVQHIGGGLRVKLTKRNGIIEKIV
ncbi:MAG: tRNA lysidine(34) synthetase TilS [Candidatus Saccharibacteria bacterium]|nr:tRNA lysidine(34) synthetase TilS [Candidatus Saccharibacteria bacterium]